MNPIIINPIEKHTPFTILLGSLYRMSRAKAAADLLRSIGLLEKFDPEVFLEDVVSLFGEDALE